MHIDSLESRQLRSGTGLDTHFAQGGALELAPGFVVLNTLSTSDLYVDAYSAVDHARYLLKFNANGRLVTSWGRRGRVTLGVFATPAVDASKLAYDPHTDSVFVADATPVADVAGENDVATFRVQRVTPDGTIYGPYGVGGVYADHTFAVVQNLVPLLHGRLLVEASTRTVSDPAADAVSTTDTLELVRLTTGGQPDASFGQNGRVAVVSTSGGNAVSFTGYHDHDDRPTFADLVVRSDGSYRVIDLRHTYAYSEDNAEAGTERAVITDGTDTQSVDSSVVDAAGVLHPRLTQTYVLSRKRVKQVTLGRAGFYVPALARAEGDDGVAVVGGRSVSGAATDAGVLRLRPGVRSKVTAFAPGGGTLIATFASDLYDTVFAQFAGKITAATVVSRFSPGLVFDPFWGDAGRLTISDTLTVRGFNGAGRLYASDGGTLYRFDGR